MREASTPVISKDSSFGNNVPFSFGLVENSREESFSCFFLNFRASLSKVDYTVLGSSLLDV